MSFLDKITDRVGGFLDEVFLPEGVAQTLQQASEAIAREDYEAALGILYRTHAEHPSVQRTHHLIGLCLFHQERYDEALSAFERAIDQRDEPLSRLYAGLSAEQIGRLHDAQLHFRRGRDQAGDSEVGFDLLFGLGRAYRAQGRADKAARELRKAVKLKPDDPDAAVALARAYRARLGDTR